MLLHLLLSLVVSQLSCAQWYVSELIGILLCLTVNKAQYKVLIHNRMHSLKICSIVALYIPLLRVYGPLPSNGSACCNMKKIWNTGLLTNTDHGQLHVGTNLKCCGNMWASFACQQTFSKFICFYCSVYRTDITSST
jgi:hypothetical protein